MRSIGLARQDEPAGPQPAMGAQLLRELVQLNRTRSNPRLLEDIGSVFARIAKAESLAVVDVAANARIRRLLGTAGLGQRILHGAAHQARQTRLPVQRPLVTAEGGTGGSPGALIVLPLAASTKSVAVVVPGVLSDADLYDMHTGVLLLAAAFINQTAEADELQRLALTDPLTGLANRRALDEKLRAEWALARRAGHEICAIIMDIDFFGAYNNRYGHPAGDDCLRAVAQVLSAVVNRETDLVARYGGEEFIAVLPATDAAGGIVVAERLREAIAARSLVHESTELRRITMSMGIAAMRASRTSTYDDLIARADEMLLRAKASGRNRAVSASYESNAAPNPRRHELCHNLPAEVTPFCGRDLEVGAISDLLARGRILTLAGFGGAGKTRLACEVARRIGARFADGVVFVDLSIAQNAEMATSVLAQTLKVSSTADRSLDEGILHRLEAMQAMLILDNCEHVVERIATFVGSALKRSESLRILCTSREPLQIRGEVVYRIDALAKHDATRLFSERVADAMGASASPADQTLLEKISARLDRLPLALELVAPRVASDGALRVLEALSGEDFVLSASLHHENSRQKTIGSLLDWSYRLLHARERAVLRRLAVLRGEWSIDDAFAVCCGIDDARERFVATLDELTRKSLLVRLEDGRYKLLELTAEFARQQLRRAHELDTYRGRQANHFLQVSRAISAENTRGYFRNSGDILTRSAANAEAALDYLLRLKHDVEAGAELAANLSRAWEFSGRIELASRWLELALAGECELSPHVRAKVFAAAAYLADAHADAERIVEYAQRALELFSTWDEPVEMATALRCLANGKFFLGDYETAERLYTRSIDYAESAGNTACIATALINLGNIAYERHQDLEAASRLYSRAIEMLESIEQQPSLGIALMNFSEVQFRLGNLAQAISLAERSTVIFESAGTKTVGVAYTNLASFRREFGDLAGARTALCQALETYRSFENPRWEAMCFEEWARFAHQCGHDADAARLLGFLAPYRNAGHIALPALESDNLAALESVVRERTAGAFESYRTEGNRWSRGDAVACCMHLT